MDGDADDHQPHACELASRRHLSQHHQGDWQPRFNVFTQIVWNARRSVSPAQQAFVTTAQEALSSGSVRSVA